MTTSRSGTPRRRAIFWGAVCVAVALVITGGAVAWAARSRATGAAAVVRAYFAALERGDAAAALGYGTVPPGPHALLTTPILQAQERLAPLHDVEVTQTRTSGDTGMVRVRYAAGRSVLHDVIPVVRDGRNWRLAASAVRVRLSLTNARQRASILGRTVPATPVLVFPGIVPVRFDSPYLEIDAGRAMVRFSTSGPVVLPVRLSTPGLAAITGAIRTAVTACVRPGRASDPSCPLPDATYVPGSIRGRVVSTAGLRVDLQVSAAGLVTVAGPVVVAGDYQRLTYANVAVAGHGRVQLDLAADVYATRQLVVHWSGP